MIRKVFLKNWRSHEESEFEFGSGTNMLMGVMGGGKTSVVEALCYGLFGNFPALQKRRVKLSEVISSWPREEKEAEVKVAFDCGGENYEVKRVFGAGVTKAELRKNGKMEEAQPEKVSERVEKILKVEYELFSRAIYSEQNGIDRFLNLNPGERKKQFDELFGIDKFEVVRGNLNKVLNELKALKENEEKELKGMKLENALKEAEKTEKQLEEIKIERGKAGEECKKAIGELEKKMKELKEEEEKEAAFNKLKREIARAEGELSGLEKESMEAETKGAEEIDGMKSKENGLRSQVDSGKKHLKKISGESDELNRKAGAASERMNFLKEKTAEKQRLEKSLNEFRVNASAVREERDKARANVEKGREYCAQLRAELNELDKGIAELGREISACPVCETPLTKEKKETLLKEKKEKKKKREEMLKGVADALATEARALESIENNLKRIEDCEKKIAESKEVEKELEKTAKELGECEAKKRLLCEERKGLEEKISQEEKEHDETKRKREKIEAAVEKTRRFMQLKETLEKLRKEEEKISFIQEKTLAARREAERLSSLKSMLMEKTNGLNREEKRMRELLEIQEEKIKEAKKRGELISEYEKAFSETAVLQNAVVETQKNLREGLVEAVDTAMNGVWSVLYPYGDYNGLHLRAEANDYILELKRGMEWVSVEGIASGGERVCASLSLRIAVATVLVPNLSWLILDEPTHNLDGEGVRTLAKALAEQIPQIVQQTIVITHDENLKDAATARVYVLLRDKTKGEKTKAEEISG